MTNEQVIKRINEIREILADYRELTSYDHEALDIAISALSKQSASCEQADKKLFGHGYWLMPGEVFISHNVLNEVLNTIIKSMNTEQRKIDSILAKTDRNDEAIRKDDHIADDSKMVDQFREATKMTEDVPDTNVGKTDFKPETVTNCHDLMDDSRRQAAIDALEAKKDKSAKGDIGCFYNTIIQNNIDALKGLPSAQPEPLSDAYMNAVWTWLIDYQIKAAELKGRYTPYEVLSWVVNDWRKEHERSDKQTDGD